MTQVKDLQVGEVENGRREATGEGVVLQVNSSKKRTARERRGYRAIKVVGVKTQLTQLRQVADFMSESTGELKARKTELVDAGVEADNAAPVAGSGRRGRVPGVESAKRVMEVLLEGD